MSQEMTGKCDRCSQYFYYTRKGMHSKQRKYCDGCTPIVKREQARERKRRQRAITPEKVSEIYNNGKVNRHTLIVSILRSDLVRKPDGKRVTKREAEELATEYLK